jgi:hypothetical protein
MTFMISLGPMTKILLVGVWILLTVVVVLLFVQKSSDSASTRIVIQLTDELQRANLRFGVLHARDGKDDIPGSGPILNEEVSFKQLDRHGTMEATISYSKRLGFQFKCFVDHGELEYEKIKQLLEDAGFLEISKGQGKRFRIWFILKGYPTYQTMDGFINNYFYPA